ncbi:hypothetical protein BURK2_02930 [Burkholderiales bacterium]|nr:hypothetical protein BURK2_02930 [Burkholderiales bacterium]
MSIITVGFDLAKNVYAVHGVDDSGRAALVKPKVTPEYLLPLIAHLPPCLPSMEACSGTHHWARLFRPYGHTVRLMALKFVTPCRMTGKRQRFRFDDLLPSEKYPILAHLILNLLGVADEVAAAGVAPMSMEVNAEVKAAREQRRQSADRH